MVCAQSVPRVQVACHLPVANLSFCYNTLDTSDDRGDEIKFAFSVGGTLQLLRRNTGIGTVMEGLYAMGSWRAFGGPPLRDLDRFGNYSGPVICGLPSFRFLGERKARDSVLVDGWHKEKRTGVRASKRGDDKGINSEIRVCTNRSCRRLGSLQTLDVLRSLAPPGVAVEPCGCLGNCGSGPNLVVLPAELVIRHCSTAMHAARLLELQCGAADPVTNLKALHLKELGNKSFQQGNHEQAERYYSEAIELNPSGGIHFLYGNRSAVRLARGDDAGALDDAEQAVRILPTWSVAHLRKVDVYLQMGALENAELACSSALRLDPSLRRSKSFQAKVKQISERLELARVSV
ncbi:hypothetical protein R1sor_016020 [Riccia sorocarpa]|uniref:Tetratricopeptide repeat protein n=1 Tax=Riccia sorocarpa TaxID=122646 RepID=A0ABD3HI05_9MARC